jgi:hypothetical protein
MQRLNERLREDPEFAKQWATDRAARMQVINSRRLRRTAEDLNRIPIPPTPVRRKPRPVNDICDIQAGLDLTASIATGEDNAATLGKAREALDRMRVRFGVSVQQQ